MSIEAILLYLANNNFTYEYVLIFFVLSIIGFSLPIPYTLIIITNIYVFGWVGFFLVILSVPLGSLITFFFIKKFTNFIRKIKLFHKIFKNKLINKIKFYNNVYILILTRATVPFFLASVIFSLTNISIKKYLYTTIIGTFSYIFLCSLIINSVRDSIINYNDIIISWNDPRLFLSLIIMLLLVFFGKKINTKLFNNNKK
jgi:uncharacterized membrane protein YdjX (TVP38/TMEM64 family)